MALRSWSNERIGRTQELIITHKIDAHCANPTANAWNKCYADGMEWNGIEKKKEQNSGKSRRWVLTVCA